ncbi:hypothetical protein [Shinella sp.]|uniref:hypothetical protein n=1 Tax=Shinella sp. TaxID=1870904 RepID=UPI0025864D35|nr:hypothetical protein [Shinella sp.]MCW5706742.1 hypothetical protein [Shinella sp.]
MIERAYDDVTTQERLVMETRIYSALQHLSAIAGEDMLGLEFYQRTRMDAAASAVAKEQEWRGAP